MTVFDSGCIIPLFSYKATRKKALRRIGLGLSLLILVVLLREIYRRVSQTAGGWQAIQPGNPGWLLAAVALLCTGLGVEARKWKVLLAASGISVSYREALGSVLSGIAVSIVTPNRVGDYPARMLALKRKPVSSAVAAILGALSQMTALLCWGVPAVFLSGTVGAVLPQLLSGVGAVLGALIGLTLYIGAHRWSGFLIRIPLLRRLGRMVRVLQRVRRPVLIQALGWSLLRFALYTTQLWLLLHWLSVPSGLPEGWMRCALFFWLLAIIPNFALAEVGIRGTVALYLFDSGDQHGGAIVAATVGLWLLNLALPAVVGAIRWIRWKQPSSFKSV
jgi:uncharacterized membrane protein YbhN (UPF0104 family)